MKQKMLLIQEDAITGFSYSFTVALLQELKKILDNGNGLIEISRSDSKGYLSPQTKPVVEYLCEQICFRTEDRWSQKDLIFLAESAEKFLAIFEKK